MNGQPYSIFQVGRIIAGIGCMESLVGIVGDYSAKSVLIITDKVLREAGLTSQAENALFAARISVNVIDNVPPEPEVIHVEATLDQARKFSPDLIIGFGGGSVMDVAKLVAVLLANPLTIQDLLQGSGIPARGVPTVMVPTTAGTGAEVTQNAIVLVPEAELKIGIVSGKMVPDCALLDPLLTVGLPPAVTATTGMDALAHGMECFLSKKASPLSDTYALRCVQLVFRSIRQAYRNGDDLQARQDMLLGAMFGGMAIASSSTVAVHALAYPLGGKYRIPHGLSNAVLLPAVMEFNLDGSEERFAEIAAAMGMNSGCRTVRESAEKVITALYDLLDDLQLRVDWKQAGLCMQDVDGLAEAAAKVTRLLNNNPKPMSQEAMKMIYRKVLSR